MNTIGTNSGSLGHAKKHGVSTEYEAWRGMKRRCTNPKDKKYKYYGGRGITFCPRWSKYSAFFSDMGFKPTPEHTLDRIDSNGNYQPDNCRWATWLEQENNRRDNRFLTHDGQTMTVAQWAREIGMKPARLTLRLWRGWSVDRALTQKPRRRAA